MPPAKPRISRFNYLELNPWSWSSHLKALREAGVEVIQVHIPWGAHEPMKGARDFQSATRLRIEKLFVAAQQENLGVDVQLGFPAGDEIFPTWLKEAGEEIFIPSGCSDSEAPPYSMVAVPSILNDESLSQFLLFMGEVLELAGLYREPEGRIRSVSFDLGLYRDDLLNPERFIKLLRTRYHSISELNRKFDTSFREFPPHPTTNFLRTLLDKRPWLALHEVRACQKLAYEPIVQMIQKMGVPRLVGTQTGKTEKYRAVLLMDDKYLSAMESSYWPWCPLGVLHPKVVRGYRIADFLMSKARQEGILVRVVGDDNRMDDPEVFAEQVWVVAGHTFLSSVLAEQVRSHIKRGGRVFFPFGKCRYNENLELLDWPASQGRNHVLVAETLPPLNDTALWDHVVKPLGNLETMPL